MPNKKIFLNPFTDFGFKKLFGEEVSKDLLIDFLNQLLPEKYKVDTLTFINPEAYPDNSEDRKAFFDIHCISKTGERFIVEMQKARMEFFKDRLLFYSTFPIRDQAIKGNWDFNLQPVYFVAILDFMFTPAESQNNKIKTDVMLKDQNGNVFYDKLHFCFVQMPIFNKKETELETHFDKWLFFLKNLENFESIPEFLNEPVFKKGFEIARLANLKPTERNAYKESVKNYLDMMNIVETARKEGQKEQAVEVAKAMIKDHLPLDHIIKYSGLSKEEVLKLIKNQNKA